MCSTPKPKRSVQVKKANNRASILGSMNSEQRQRFSQRANQASERRIEAKQLKLEKHHRTNKSIVKKSSVTTNKTNTNKNKSWLYCLLNAPLSEIMRKLVS